MPFNFSTTAFTDTTVKVVLHSWSSSDMTVVIDGQTFVRTPTGYGTDGEGGATDSGDVVGLEVGLYSDSFTVSSLTKNTEYSYTVEQDGVTLTGTTNTNPETTSKYTLWQVSCHGPAQGHGVPTSTDRYSKGMWGVIRADIEASNDRPVRAIIGVDDMDGYVDGGRFDDTAGTGRFTGAPEDQDSEHAYLLSYGCYLGLGTDLNATGQALTDSGFRQVRFSNPDYHFCRRNAPLFLQVGDHTYRGYQGGSLKDISTYINARNAWDHSLGMNTPTLLDPTAVGDYKGVGTAWTQVIGSMQVIAPDREYNASGPEATNISTVTIGATTTIDTASSHYFKNTRQACVLTGVTGSPDINGQQVISSITDDNTLVLDLNTTGGGPYSGGTVEGLPLKKSIENGGTGWIGNGDTEDYFSIEQIDLLKAAVEADTSVWRLLASSVDMFYQAPVAIMDAASAARDSDPANNLGGGRYGSQQPLGGYNPREMKWLMTQDDSGGNADQGLMGKAIRKGFQLLCNVGDHHHPGCKVIYKPPADADSDWFRMVQLWTGSCNQSTAAQEMHEDCLTKWKSHEGTTMYWLPPVNTLTTTEQLATDLPEDTEFPISAIRMIVDGENSVESTIFNERGEILFSMKHIRGEGNIPRDIGFLNGYLGSSID